MKRNPIALAAGGTGGHLFPAQALAQELKRRGRSVLLVTDARGARYAQDFPADARFEVSAATPSIGGPIAKVSAGFSIVGGLFTAFRKFGEYKPVAAVGFGGYPSLPAMTAAALIGIPYALHEQNSVLGRTNRLLAGGAKFIGHAFPVIDKVSAKARLKSIEVGNPVRDTVAVLESVGFTPPDTSGPINLLIFGGSQGSSIFSEAPVRAIAALPEAIRHRLSVAHQVRENDLEAVRAGYSDAGVVHQVAPFFEDLPERMAWAHLVVSRAGASTVTELSAIGRPSILVPLAIALDDHQTGNARVLSEVDAAFVLPEKHFTQEALRSAMVSLLTEAGRLEQMAAAAHGRVKRGASVALADLVEEISRKNATLKDA